MWIEITEDGYFIQELPINPKDLVAEEALSRYVKLPDNKVERIKEYARFGRVQIDVTTKKLIIAKEVQKLKKRFERKFKQGLTQIEYKGVKIVATTENLGILSGYILANIFPIYWQSSNFDFVEINTPDEAIELLKKVTEALNMLFKQQMQESEEKPEE